MFFRIRKGINYVKYIFFCRNMFTECDVIKTWVRPYLHKVTSSQFGATLFDTASHRRVTRCQLYNFVKFTTKTEESVVFFM